MRKAALVFGLVIFAAMAAFTPPAQAAFDVQTALPTAGRPYAIAVNPVTHRAYVAHELRPVSVVTVINTLTNGIVTTIAVGDNAKAIAVNTVSNKVYVANYDGNSTSVIDGSCNCVTGSLPFGVWGPSAVAVDETTNRVFVGTNVNGPNGHM